MEYQAAQLRVRISVSGGLRGSVSIPQGYADYTGPYEVTPKVEAQSLPTRDKHMIQDVSVREIPFYKTSNAQQGETVYIAKELND